MNFRPSLWISTFCFWLCLTPFVVAESPPGTPADIDAIRTTITNQWAAFAENDATRALSFAVPEIRDQFEAPEGFLLMVQVEYPVVFHHVAFRFLNPRFGSSFSFQWVRMTDSEGSVWLVLYELHRESDGTWLIGGVLEYAQDAVPDFLPPSTDS